MKVLLVGMSKDEFAKQPSSIESFHVGSSNNTPKKQHNNTPKQQSQSYLKSDNESPAIKPPIMALQGTSKKHQHSYQPQIKKIPTLTTRSSSFVRLDHLIPKDQLQNLE